MNLNLSEPQKTMVSPQLNLALASDTALQNRQRVQCLVDTGCSLPLIIDKNTYIALGKPKLADKKVKIVVAGGEKLYCPVCNLTLILETLDDEWHFETMGVIIAGETGCTIGSPLLKTICIDEEVELVFNYRKELLELKRT